MGEGFQGLQLDIGKAEDDIFYADPPFLHLAEYAVRYGDDYMRFVEDIETAKDQLAHIPPFEDDAKTSTADELWKRPIHLMTAIRAKGKEFDTVILLDVNDEIWPNRNAKTPAQKEAERRVFYVAFTRARKRVLMFVSNNYRNRKAAPSPYVDELELTVG
jgi:DNA helicase-2/ATP-dependent DNA helicase PcrA